MTAEIIHIETDAERTEKRFKAAVGRSHGSLKEAAIEAVALGALGYTNAQISALVGKSPKFSQRLRKWAAAGFTGEIWESGNKKSAPTEDSLKSNENFENDTFEPDENVEDPAAILTNVLDSIKQSKGVAEAYRKILKVSPFDREAKKQISNEIELLIRKWRSVQSILTMERKTDVS